MDLIQTVSILMAATAAPALMGIHYKMAPAKVSNICVTMMMLYLCDH